MSSSLDILGLPEAPDWQHPAFGNFPVHPLVYRDQRIEYAAEHLRGRLVYLASPYTKVVQENGVWSARRSAVAAGAAEFWASRLAFHGVCAVSPIVQAHRMVMVDIGEVLDPLDTDFWTGWCAPILAAASAVVIPPIEGWKESAGVWREARMALGAVKPVWILAGDD